MNINTKNVAFKSLQIYSKTENANNPSLIKIKGNQHKIEKSEGNFIVNDKTCTMPAYIIDGVIKVMAEGTRFFGEKIKKGDGVDTLRYNETPDITDRVIPAVDAMLKATTKCLVDTTNKAAVIVSATDK